VSLQLFPQITITENDMPQPDDLIHYNITYPFGGVDYKETGDDFTWDFSALASFGQEADTFVTVSSTPLLYQAVFNWPFWNPPASIAQRKGDFTMIPGLTMNDYIDYFKNTNNSFNFVGFGVTINNLPIPLKFDNPEVVYKFPVTSSSIVDSSEAGFSQNIPDMGYFEVQRKRVNEVDGWGTLITPLGTFQVLRLKSTVYAYDSIYIDSLSAGYAVNIEEVEYKWLGNGYGRPLLKVTESNILPTRAEYIAEAILPLEINAGEDVTITLGDTVQLEATVEGGVPPYVVIWSNEGFGTSISVSPQFTTTYTATVTDLNLTSVSDDITVTVEAPPVQQIIELPSGWSSISTFAFPENLQVSEILAPIEGQLIIFQNSEGFYMPESGTNTLGDWDINSGYMIKMDGPASLQINGHEPATKSVFLSQGWNIMPIVSTCDVDVSVISAQLNDNLKIIKEIAGTGIYWPDKTIETIQVLEPGKAYMIMINVETQLIFPDCE
jgi:hypothetical protein